MTKLTPTAAVRAYCTHCLGMVQFNSEQVKDCQGNQAYQGFCPFFPYCMGKRIPVKVFRAFCLQCMGGDRELVKECETVNCPVHPYRMGKNPAKKGQGASSEIMRKVRGSRKSRLESIFTGESMDLYISRETRAFRLEICR